jgi:hypothetical protein
MLRRDSGLSPFSAFDVRSAIVKRAASPRLYAAIAVSHSQIVVGYHPQEISDVLASGPS